jgi:defect-in-organelle-trafficking protein DotC
MNRSTRSPTWSLSLSRFAAAGFACLLSAAAFAVPPVLEDVQGVRGQGERTSAEQESLRGDALRDAALSFGIRAGLARKTWENNQLLDTLTSKLDATYDWRALMLKGPAQTLLEPPIVADVSDALDVAKDGQSTAQAARLLRIIADAKMTTVARSWRDYLVRSAENAELPPAILLPRTDSEIERWRVVTAEGWSIGLAQANETFSSDLARLERDYIGAIRFRELVALNMAAMPHVELIDRGVTGNNREIRIGDREIRITGQGALDSVWNRWMAVPK